MTVGAATDFGLIIVNNRTIELLEHRKDWEYGFYSDRKKVRWFITGYEKEFGIDFEDGLIDNWIKDKNIVRHGFYIDHIS